MAIDPISGRQISGEEARRLAAERKAAEDKAFTPIQGSMNNTPNLARNLTSTFDPTRVTQIRDELGRPPQVQAPEAMAPAFAAQYAPKPVQGLSQDFFQSQREELKDQLRREFFGPVGVAQQAVSGESAAGRLGSGVGKRIIEETVTRPFIDASVKIDRALLQEQMKEMARVQEFNAEQANQFSNRVATLAAADSQNKLVADRANAELQASFYDFASRLADAEAGRMTEMQLAQLDSDTRLYISAQDTYFRTQALEEEMRRNKANEQIELLRTLGQFKPESIEQRSLIESLTGGYGVPTAGEGDSQLRELGRALGTGYPGQRPGLFSSNTALNRNSYTFTELGQLGVNAKPTEISEGETITIDGVPWRREKNRLVRVG